MCAVLHICTIDNRLYFFLLATFFRNVTGYTVQWKWMGSLSTFTVPLHHKPFITLTYHIKLWIMRLLLIYCLKYIVEYGGFVYKKIFVSYGDGAVNVWIYRHTSHLYFLGLYRADILQKASFPSLNLSSSKNCCQKY